MKKRNKILSVVLAVFLIFSGVQFVSAKYVDYKEYTVTGTDGKTYRYFSDGTQFIRKGNSDNAFMNIWVDNHYRFMLTEETQKFYFVQNLRLQHEYEFLQSKSTYFDKIELYTGQELTGTPDIQPTEEQKNSTNELIESYKLQKTFWTAANDNAQEKVDALGASYIEGTIPAQYEFHANAVSFGGNKNYYWDGLSSFETSDGFQKSFYNVLSWYSGVDAKNAGVPTNYVVFGITLDVTDVRELISKVDEYKEIIANPEGYTSEQVEQYSKYIASVPEGMLEGTTYYTQEQVDTVYDYITGEIDGFADTEEYMYYRLKALDIISKDANGNYVNTDVYTSDSLSAFETEFKAIDIGAYFPYPASRQAEVDEATANLKASFNYLAGANTRTQTSNGTTTDTVWDSAVDKSTDDTVNARLKASLTNTSYKFVQVNDDQPFVFSQLLYAEAQNVSWYSTSKPTITSFVFDEADCANATNCSFNEDVGVANNTTEFINHLDVSNKTTTDGITNYVGWFYNSRSGDYDKSFIITDGVISSTEITADTEMFASTTYHYYYADANIQFTGNEKETDENGNRVTRDSEIDLSFYWKLTSTLDGTEYHAHIPVEILVTDVRPLLDIYDELYKFSNFSANTEERTKYTAESVEAVKTALASVPLDMVYGTTYYTQEEVNNYYNALLTAKNSLESTAKADYTELDTAILNAETVLNGETVYTDATKTALENAIADAKAVERDLSADKQSVVDSATQKLTDAVSALKEKADYSSYNDLKAELDEIINGGNNGSHTDEEWQEFVDSVTEIDNALNKDLSKDEQTTVDSAVEQLTNAKEVYDGRQTADYTALEEAIKNAEAILNDTETVYTNSSKAELERVYNSAVSLDKNLPVSEQAIVDEMVAGLTAAVSGVKVKADYSAFDEAVKNAEEALNNTEITYTSSTKQALENALNLKETVGRDLSTDEQAEIDSVTNAITEATTNLTEAADVSAYEEAKETADEILAGGNDNGRYPEEIWDSLVESVTEAENVIGDNTSEIPKIEQQKLNDITEKLNNAISDIENKSYIFVEFRDEHNNIFETFRIMKDEGKTFNDLEGIPAIPESNSLKKYLGWYYADGKKMNLTDAITKDVALFCIEEEIKLVTDSESGAFIDEENDFFNGLEHGTTVENLLLALENDLDYIKVKDKDGNEVEETAVVATGMTVELISKTEQTVKNEIVTVVVKGDINGDGLVNDDDFDKSVDMCLGNTSYTESEKAYFEANDIDDDGVLDGIDLFFISNMRFGN